MVNIYISKTCNTLNKMEVNTEHISDYVCLNPNYKHIKITNKNVKVLMDSGAFQDRNHNTRLSFDVALRRQLNFEHKLCITSEKIVAYDMIDDYKTTVKANQFLASKREKLQPRQLVLMIQGKTFEECVECVIDTLKIAQPGDCIGFGGVAPSGRNKKIRNKLYQTIQHTVPLIYEYGITDIHIFGIGMFQIIEEILEIIKQHDCVMNVSCDASSFEIRSVLGYILDIDSRKWIKTYSKEQKYTEYHPCILAQQNIASGIKIMQEIV